MRNQIPDQRPCLGTSGVVLAIALCIGCGSQRVKPEPAPKSSNPAELRQRVTALQSQPGGSAADKDWKSLLGDPDPTLRQAAARAMAKIGTPEAKAALEERLAVEEIPAVRDVIQQSLTMIEP